MSTDSPRPSFYLRLLARLLALALLALPASATWSIVLVNVKTGEVAVGCATCIPNFGLERWVPVIVPGIGAAASQSSLDTGGVNRVIIHAGLLAGLTPEEILADLLVNGTLVESRQWGITAFTGPSASFTGSQAGAAICNVVGQSGDIFYAIQGNVLAGAEICAAGEEALVNTPGDVSTKLMAAMVAVRAIGGDGRCSCSPTAPDSCGVPPPDFERSANTGFVIVARVGDVAGVCDAASGCANGVYFLNLVQINTASGPDPVDELVIDYANWRAGLARRPDGILSSATLDRTSLPADGRTVAIASIRLADIDGVALTAGGADVQVIPAPGSASDALAGPVTDNGDGSYSVPITAGLAAGNASFVISADDGVVNARLYPDLVLRVDALTPLHCGFDLVSATQGARVPLVVNQSSAPGAFYVIVASLSGTRPGTQVGDVLVPLNFDEVTRRSLFNSNNPRLPGTRGFLDASGRAEGAFAAPPGLLGHVIGERVDWVALTFDGHSLSATNAAGFSVVHGP